MSGTPAAFEVDRELLDGLAAHEREEVEAQLARFSKGVERNPLWGISPFEKQRRYLSIDTILGGFLGGNQAGKSFTGTLDDIIQAVDVEALPPWLEPYKRYDEFHGRVGTPNEKTTLEPVVLPLFRRLCPKDQLKGGSWDKAYSHDLRTLTFKNHNTIDFLTYKMDLDAWSGATKHRVRFDEEPPGQYGRTIFEESLMRIIALGGEIRFTLTPLLGLSWTYRVLTERGRPRWDDEVRAQYVDQDDNPYLDKKTAAFALRGMSPEVRAARKSGRYVHFEGLIYPEFDRNEHVVPDEPLPRDRHGNISVPIFNAIDPGRDHPAAVVWAWLDRDGRLVVFECFKVAGENVQQIATRINAVEERLEIKPRWRVIDPSARNKLHLTGRSIQDQYRKNGIHTIPGQNSRGAGYNAVSELLTADPPKLHIFASCAEIADEFEEYRWKPKPRSEDVGKEEPIKRNDDLLDALRYLVMQQPTFGRREEPDVPPDDPAEFQQWEQARRVRGHIQRLAGRRRGNRRHAGVQM